MAHLSRRTANEVQRETQGDDRLEARLMPVAVSWRWMLMYLLPASSSPPLPLPSCSLSLPRRGMDVSGTKTRVSWAHTRGVRPSQNIRVRRQERVKEGRHFSSLRKERLELSPPLLLSFSFLQVGCGRVGEGVVNSSTSAPSDIRWVKTLLLRNSLWSDGKCRHV